MDKQSDPDWDTDSPEIVDNQVTAYDEMRQRCPVAYSEARGYSVFRHRDVQRILADHETFSNSVSQHLSVPNGMDPPEHTPYRQIIEPYFSPEQMRSFEPACRQLTASLLQEKLIEGRDVEVMGQIGRHFAVRVQCEFLGWPAALHDKLISWTERSRTAARNVDRIALSELAREFEAIVDELIEQRIDNDTPADEDLTTRLMREKIHHRTLSNEEVASILRNWTVGEAGTIAASIAILVHALAADPDLQKRLRNDSSLLTAAADEILRVHNPLVGNRRRTTCPVELGGQKIDADQRISINWVSANRDESVFPDATTVRLDRDASKNLLYGAGVHICPGAPLARLELRVFLEELLSQTESIALSATKPPVMAEYPASGYTSLNVRFQLDSAKGTDPPTH